MAGNPVKELSVSVLVGAGGGRPQPCKPFRNASQAYLRQALQRFGPTDCWRCKSTKRGFFGCSIVVPGPAVVEMTCKQPQKHQGGDLKLCACVSCASFDSA